VQNFILEMAKANYYYLNNTKEFGSEYVLDTIGTNRVSGAIASVTGTDDEKAVFKQLILRRYPSIKEQAWTCVVGLTDNDTGLPFGRCHACGWAVAT